MVVGEVTTTTLAIVNTPTLLDGLVTFLRIGEALEAAASPMLGGCGVTIYEDEHGHALEVEPDRELPAGVLEYVRRLPVDPWHDRGTVLRRPDDYDAEAAAARLELLELLAHVTHGDIIATAQGVELL